MCFNIWEDMTDMKFNGLMEPVYDVKQRLPDCVCSCRNMRNIDVSVFTCAPSNQLQTTGDQSVSIREPLTVRGRTL